MCSTEYLGDMTEKIDYLSAPYFVNAVTWVHDTHQRLMKKSQMTGRCPPDSLRLQVLPVNLNMKKIWEFNRNLTNSYNDTKIMEQLYSK